MHKARKILLASAIAASLSSHNPFFNRLLASEPKAAKPIVAMAQVADAKAQFGANSKLEFSSETRAELIPLPKMEKPGGEYEGLPQSVTIPPSEVPKTPSEWAGFAALILSSVAFAFQLARNWKVKVQKDISLDSWITSVFMDGAWAAYGAANGMFSVALSNCIALVPRTAGVYQIVRGNCSTMREGIAKTAQESIHFAGKLLSRANGQLNHWMWIFVADPINALIFAVTIPSYLQYHKTMREKNTDGISLSSQASYFLSSVGWGINAYVFGKNSMIAACVAGLVFYGGVAKMKVRQMRSEGKAQAPS